MTNGAFFNTLGGAGGRSQGTGFMSAIMMKTNDWYYKPNSQPACPVGGSCNRGVLNSIKRRT